jgi:hypothetical protein
MLWLNVNLMAQVDMCDGSEEIERPHERLSEITNIVAQQEILWLSVDMVAQNEMCVGS